MDGFLEALSMQADMQHSQVLVLGKDLKKEREGEEEGREGGKEGSMIMCWCWGRSLNIAQSP